MVNKACLEYEKMVEEIDLEILKKEEDIDKHDLNK